MVIIIDSILVLLVVIFFFVGIKRGFIRELVSLIGFVVALVAAYFLSGFGSSLVYDTFVDGYVQEKVSTAVVSSVNNEVDGVMVSIPEYYINAAETVGVDLEHVVKSNMGSTVQETADSVAQTVSTEIARPVIGGLIRIILFFILFIIVKLIIDWIGRALDIVARLPIIHGANKILGGFVGAIRGAGIAFIVSFIFYHVVNFSKNGVFGITAATLDATRIFSLLAEIFK